MVVFVLSVWAQDDLLKLLEAMKVALPPKDLTKYKTSESHLDWQKVAFNSFTAEMCKQKWQEVSKEVSQLKFVFVLIVWQLDLYVECQILCLFLLFLSAWTTDSQIQDSNRADIWCPRLHQEPLQGQKNKGKLKHLTRLMNIYKLWIKLIRLFTFDIQKHPDFPKKPLTPYFRFFMEKRAKYAKLHPEMSNLDLTKILSKKYRELPDKKKVSQKHLRCSEKTFDSWSY